MLIDDGARAYLHEGGVLTEIDAASDTTYGLTDGLGSVRGLTDESGTLSGSASYDAFGAVTSQSGATSTFGYTGEQTDSTGNVHLRARAYDPEVGRFLSADTVQPNAPGTQGYNRYAYVANNPTTWTDPSGHAVALVLYPALALNWLAIGMMVGAMLIAIACAADPTGCETALGGIAKFVIMIFGIIACVLELGGPCWTWVPRALPRDETPPSGTIIPFTPRETQLPPGKRYEPFPPSVPGRDTGPRHRTCASEFPTYIRCDQLPGRYTYSNEDAAVDQVKYDTRYYDARKEKRRKPADTGPCGRLTSPYATGTHTNVTSATGGYLASIVSCPCCMETNGGPVRTERCGIVY